MIKETNASATDNTPLQNTLVLTQEKEEKFIICDVCGYANSHKAAMCKMCSNYLKGVK